jgi:hypothetical protein
MKVSFVSVALLVFVAGCSVNTEVGGGSSSGGVVAGTKCTGDAECGEGNRCVQGGCVALTATDGVKNGSETDVDCGGAASNPRCTTGQTCAEGTDCDSDVCNGGTCTAGSATDGKKNQGETDVDCGGPNAPKCADAARCKVGSDCQSAVCGLDFTCAGASHIDGIKNGTETDVDCGGGNGAAPCAVGQTCGGMSDCTTLVCTGNVCAARQTGVKDGDETDIDCGGTTSPKCPWDKVCAVDADCTTDSCIGNKCSPASCKGVVRGGTTCGTGEFVDGFKQHESCCKSLPVAGHSDPRFPGKQVYLDKYEITAGRMRKFVEAISAANGGVPNIKGYITANQPARWNAGWTHVLPANNGGTTVSYTVTNPTGGNLLYPGLDIYNTGAAEYRNKFIGDWYINNGTFNIDPGLSNSLGAPHFFPEFRVTSGAWPAPDYSASHGFNCSNETGSYGYGTYWFFTGVNGKVSSKEVMDEKSMNCATNAMFAAFCAWDGGQLASQEVFDYIGTPARMTNAQSNCAGGINTTGDAGGACYSIYYYSSPGAPTNYDDSARIAAPGRVAADTVRINPADEPWMDMKGNLMEAVILSDTTRFAVRGGGIGWSTQVTHHGLQASTPRGKNSSYGGRCMRFK